MSKYGVFSGPYFPVFSLNTGKYGPGKTPHLDPFHAVKDYFNRLFQEQIGLVSVLDTSTEGGCLLSIHIMFCYQALSGNSLHAAPYF